MGCNSSITNDLIARITDEQIDEIKKGTISPLSFHFFLTNFYYVSRYDKFYTELPLEKQTSILEDISPLEKDECTTVIENFCQYSQDETNIFQSLCQISLKMICKTSDETTGTDIYLPVSLDQKLWKSIMQRKFTTRFGEFKITKKMVDWTNTDLIKDRQLFIDSYDLSQKVPIPHSKDLSLLIQNNTIDNLWKKEGIKIEKDYLSKQKVSKPFFWEISIHHASFKGKISSVEYSLSLIPEMLNLPDYEDNTLVHFAALGNQSKMLTFLHEIGADFNVHNKDGYLPIHLVSEKKVVSVMNEIGIDINECNENGETLLDMKTRQFDMNMIKALLNLGINIFEPNSKGAFWIQTTMHEKYYKDKMKEEQFILFVRKLLIKNKTAKWNDNPIYREIINRKKTKNDQQNIDDLRNAVRNQEVERINVLLAIGTKADEQFENAEGTNIFYCAKNGLTNIAEILCNNYCDPNYTNLSHQNTFWVAAINEHFDTALLMKKYGADIDMIDSHGETLLHNVYRRKINNVMDFVLEAGGNPNVKNGQGETVTFIAFKMKDDAVAEVIQDKYNGDINSLDGNENSLLHLAIYQGDYLRIEYLSKRRINMDLKDKNGHSILMIAFLQRANFKTLRFLLKCGSNINTTDNDNNTMLHHLLFTKNPGEDVFKFLINKGIDYNIENKDGQFPISIAIEKSHDKLGFELLNMNCKILDPKSIHEPIVEALKRNSSKWFNELINHGADAMNEKVGVISRFINSDFYNYNVFKKIKRMNILVEAPLQMALYKKYKKCANDIWNMAVENRLTYRVAEVSDCYGRVLLSAAIITENNELVEILLRGNYECEKRDKNRRTPFIYACIADNIEWMKKISCKISLDNANIIDSNGCSALTYAAQNKRKDFCDYLFINDIDVNEPKADKNGIIDHYRKLLDRYKSIKRRAEKNYKDAAAAVKIAQQDVDSIADKERYLRDARWKIERDKEETDREYRNMELPSDFVPYTGWSYQDIRGYKESMNRIKEEEDDLNKFERQLRTFARKAQEDLRNAQYVENYYMRKYEEICNKSREQILKGMDYIENLAKRGQEIGVRTCTMNNDSDCCIC